MLEFVIPCLLGLESLVGDEVKKLGNILLVIDEVHNIVAAGDSEGGMNAANILKPALSRGEIHVIGATTLAEYRKYIEKDSALERRFQPIVIAEPSVADTVKILEGIKPYYESFHGVVIPDETVKAAVTLSERYITDRFLPDKAIDLMDEAASHLALHDKTVTDAEKAKVELDAAKAEIARLEAAPPNEEKPEEAEAYYKNLADAKTKEAKQLALYNELEERRKNVKLTTEELAKVIEIWTGVPASTINENEFHRIDKLAERLKHRIIGQDKAVEAVAKAIKRQRAGIYAKEKPVSFIFAGPTGVGKTELSKALAEAMFGTENALIRVDMSEYMEGHSVSKMIGSPPGYVGFEEGGQLSEKIRKNPYSVVLFDEIEKAHPDVFNVLLQVLDDGHITDSKGRKVSFKNTVLIMTSNAGAQRIIAPKNLGFLTETTREQDYEKMKSGVMEEVRKIFKPEFINRIDDIIVFKTLEKKEMLEIVQLLSSHLSKRCEKEMELKLHFSNALKEHIVDKYADYKMGARPLKRAIQNVIEDPLAEKILAGEIHAGDQVTIGFRKGQISFDVKN